MVSLMQLELNFPVLRLKIWCDGGCLDIVHLRFLEKSV